MIDTKMTRSRLTLLIQNLTLSFIDGAHPNFSLINVLSEFRPLTPSGPGMWWIGKFLLSKLNTISAISFILTISSLPMLTGSLKSDFVSLNHHYTLRSLDPTKFLIRSQYCLILEHYLKTPSTHSSMNVKDLVCFPSPHISNRSTEVRAFRQNAAGAFSRPPITAKEQGSIHT